MAWLYDTRRLGKERQLSQHRHRQQGPADLSPTALLGSKGQRGHVLAGHYQGAPERPVKVTVVARQRPEVTRAALTAGRPFRSAPSDRADRADRRQSRPSIHSDVTQRSPYRRRGLAAAQRPRALTHPHRFAATTADRKQTDSGRHSLHRPPHGRRGFDRPSGAAASINGSSSGL